MNLVGALDSILDAWDIRAWRTRTSWKLRSTIVLSLAIPTGALIEEISKQIFRDNPPAASD
jgi:hypothetical protein